MKLVDAIRQAALQPGIEAAASYASTYDMHADTVETTAPTLMAPIGTNLVRLEVFLSPEQTHALLRGALNTSRTVMTAREVATYLRLPVHSVEEMATQGRIPAFFVEGAPRFMKHAIDEWMTQLSSAPVQEQLNVAESV